jgi:hypothetical protein
MRQTAIWAVEVVLDQELVDGVGRDAAVNAEHFGRGRRWCDAEDDPAFAA